MFVGRWMISKTHDMSSTGMIGMEPWTTIETTTISTCQLAPWVNMTVIYGLQCLVPRQSQKLVVFAEEDKVPHTSGTSYSPKADDQQSPRKSNHGGELCCIILLVSTSIFFLLQLSKNVYFIGGKGKYRHFTLLCMFLYVVCMC